MSRTAGIAEKNKAIEKIGKEGIDKTSFFQGEMGRGMMGVCVVENGLGWGDS